MGADVLQRIVTMVAELPSGVEAVLFVPGLVPLRRGCPSLLPPDRLQDVVVLVYLRVHASALFSILRDHGFAA